MAIGNSKCILIGGASDIKQSKVFPYCFEASTDNKVERKSNMNEPRAAFGCYLDKENRRVFIIGGSISTKEASDRCEVYDLDDDAWTELLQLEMPICSGSVVSLGKWLFCFGGIHKKNGELNIVANIYRLDLEKQDKWTLLPVFLEQPRCDIGLTAISEDEILVYGGWNYNSFDNVSKLRNHEDIERITLEKVVACSNLPKSDFFVSTGLEIETEDCWKVKGHSHIFEINK